MNVSRGACAGLLVLPALVLSACQQPAAPAASNSATAAAPAAATPAAEPSGVVREETAAPVAPSVAAIQAQPGPGGSEYQLLKAAVTGDIMTLTFRCATADGNNYNYMIIDEISIIDDTTSQRIGVLKDNAGAALASPLTPDGKKIRADCDKKGNVLWAKFPAPPATSPTVSINLPSVAPFDGVPVTR